MDYNIRAAKASSISNRLAGMTEEEGVQSKVWGLISERVSRNRIENRTEDYEKLLESERKTVWADQKIHPEKSCNGLAVIMNKQIVTCDLFGNRDAFRYYFPRLKDAALMFEMPGKKSKPVVEAEAFYKLDEFLDKVEENLVSSDEPVHGLGSIRRIKKENIPDSNCHMMGRLYTWQHLLSYRNKLKKVSIVTVVWCFNPWFKTLNSDCRIIIIFEVDLLYEMHNGNNI